MDSSSEDENEYAITDTETETERDEETDEEGNLISNFSSTNRRRTVKTTFASHYYDNKKFIGSINIWEKILRREVEHNFQIQCNQLPAHNRTKICLRDIIPIREAAEHIFFGLSGCGQFMLSMTVRNEMNSTYSSFNLRYTLFFWQFHPNNPQKRMRIYHQRSLFDDHGITEPLKVTMIQWKRSAPHVLIVHGAADLDYEDSYITYAKVPKIGCVDCRQQQRLREGENENAFQNNALCLKCNLTVNIKYSKTESDRDFDPFINLLYPDRILIISNGIMHMLSIDIESPPTAASILAQCSSPIISSQSAENTSASQPSAGSLKSSNAHGTSPPSSTGATIASSSVPSSSTDNSGTRHNSESNASQMNEVYIGSDSHHRVFTSTSRSNENNNLVASIIADFSDIETDAVSQSLPTSTYSRTSSSSYSARIGAAPTMSNVTIGNNAKGKIVNCTFNDELIFNCVGKSASSSNAVSSSTTAAYERMHQELLQAEKQLKESRESVENTHSSSGASSSTTSTSNISSFIRAKRGKRQQRIVTKSYRNGVITVDMQGAVSTTTSTISSGSNNNNNNNNGSSSSSINKNDKSNAYEFSEETEKCEKISTLRKRRLAEKKYEFSEDNSENIIPFTKVRLANKGTSQSALYNVNNSPSSTSGDSIHHCPASPASLPPPSSPCASPVGGVMHSPSRYQFMSPHLSSATQHMLSFKPLGTLSPIQLSSMSKRSYFDGSMSPNSNASFLSPRRDYVTITDVVPLHVSSMPEKPVCTKKFKRRYVEEDDAASVITSEEDDCISPGYHTLLPCDVHGSSYSEMQMISKSSYQQIRCASVVVTQHSFDLETFTYYVLNTICKKNNLTFDVIADWACEPIYVCPVSSSVVGLLIAQFYARDVEAPKTNRCATCIREMGCIFHRHQCESRVLFNWNMESGECEVIDYGELIEKKQVQNSSKNIISMQRGTDLARAAKNAAAELEDALSKVQNYRYNLRVLDSNTKKSKKAIIEEDHGIEFHLTRPRSND